MSNYVYLGEYTGTSEIFPCECGKLINEFKLYLNINNGTFYTLGYGNHAHNPQFKETQLRLFTNKYINLVNLLKGFSLLYTKKPVCDVNALFLQLKHPEESITNLVEKLKINNSDLLQLYNMLLQIVQLDKLKEIFKLKIINLLEASILAKLNPLENIQREDIKSHYFNKFQEIQLQYLNYKADMDLKIAIMYLQQLPEKIRLNLEKTYPLPNNLYQLRQTNGFKKYIVSNKID